MKKINKNTKISELIKENEAAIEAIASINSHFNKLRNPLLRKILASRVTIEDAARIGKCEVDVFFKKLAEIGFEIEETTSKSTTTNIEIESNENKEILTVIKSGKVTSLDVRPALAQGEDPFKTIMAAIKILAEGYVLEIINTFEPTPLIKIINSKGYTSMVKTESNVVYTYFLKSGKAGVETTNNELIFKITVEEMEQEKANYSTKIQELDVRDLEMPLPMITILQALEELDKDAALFVHHKKIPQYLLPEVAQRNLKTYITEIDEHNVKLLIHL